MASRYNLSANHSVSKVGLAIAITYVYCKYDFVWHHSWVLYTKSFNNILYISDKVVVKYICVDQIQLANLLVDKLSNQIASDYWLTI